MDAVEACGGCGPCGVLFRGKYPADGDANRQVVFDTVAGTGEAVARDRTSTQSSGGVTTTFPKGASSGTSMTPEIR